MPGNFWKNPTGTIKKSLDGETKEVQTIKSFFNGTSESVVVDTDTYTEVHYEPILQPAADIAPNMATAAQPVKNVDLNNNVAPLAEVNSNAAFDLNDNSLPTVSVLGDSVNEVD